MDGDICHELLLTAHLNGLANKGFGREPMAEIRRIIEAENSDLFDVLAYVAFALQRYTRQERAAKATPEIQAHYTDKQQAFLEFVLKQYVKEGVDKLDLEKLLALLKLSYGGIANAELYLGTPQRIKGVFLGFQKYLYAWAKKSCKVLALP